MLDDAVSARSAAAPGRVPLVIAHRGSSLAEPEHTLSAYRRAIEEGADALECDVRLTADSHLVCVHDRRVNRTSNGRGSVSTLELAELEGLDWGSWKQEHEGDLELPDRDRNMLLTLRALLTMVTASDRPIGLVIETKHPTRYAGLVERKLAAMLAEFGWTDEGAPVRVMSFSYTALQRMRRLAPALPLVMLIEKRHHWPMLQGVIADDWILGPGIDLLRESPRFAAKLRATGRDLHVWTVNTAEDLQVCLDHGVKAVITDKPGDILEMLHA